MAEGQPYRSIRKLCFAWPASDAPVIAAKFVDILGSRLPDGVVNYIPGSGSEIGDYLVRQVRIIHWLQRGRLRINRLASETSKRPEMDKESDTEMGKDCVVDERQTPMPASTGAVASAFGFQGQKMLCGITDHRCS